MEHIIRRAITNHLEENNILSDSQYGFRQKRSCETQLINVTNDFSLMLDRNQQCDAILLDFEKAFDKVPHSRLIHKLHSVGINDKTIQWITSFLRNRTQQVIIEGAKSDISNVTSGVPQGSVLGPTLFLIYINDISDGLESTIRLFADDTIIYRCIESQNDVTILQEDLHKLENWENKWLMSFNTSKCQHLPITNKRNPIKSDYSLHNQRLETVKDAKYLGVNLNEKLNWSNHIDNICKKSKRIQCFHLSKSSWYLEIHKTYSFCYHISSCP